MENTGINTSSTMLPQAAPAMPSMDLKKQPEDVLGKKYVAQLQEKYKKEDGESYLVQTVINQDDEEEKTYRFVFRKPSVPSYDRYAKTSSTSATRALKTFVLDNICEEQKDTLEDALEELPAMAISLGEKLLNMLGLSKETTVKKL